MGLKAERQVQDHGLVEVKISYTKVSLTLQLLTGIFGQLWQPVNEETMPGHRYGSLVPR